MRKTRLWLISVGSCLVLAAGWGILAIPGTAVAQKKPTTGPQRDNPADAFLGDIDTDAIQSDFLGPYSHGQDAVECYVTSGRGQFWLFTRTFSPNGLRTFCVVADNVLDLNKEPIEPIEPDGGECDFTGCVDARMRTQKEFDLRTLTEPTTMTFHIRVADTKRGYWILDYLGVEVCPGPLARDLDGDGDLDSPDTWVISTDPTVDDPLVSPMAIVTRSVKNKNEDCGLFDVPFRVMVTLQ